MIYNREIFKVIDWELQKLPAAAEDGIEDRGDEEHPWDTGPGGSPKTEAYIRRFKHTHLALHLVCMLSLVRLFVIPWTVTSRVPLSMGFSQQEYWTELPCPPPGCLLDPGLEPESLASPALQTDSLPQSHWGSPTKLVRLHYQQQFNAARRTQRQFFPKVRYRRKYQSGAGIQKLGDKVTGGIWSLWHPNLQWASNTVQLLGGSTYIFTLNTVYLRFYCPMRCALLLSKSYTIC